MFKKYVRYKGRTELAQYKGTTYAYQPIYYVEVLWAKEFI